MGRVERAARAVAEVRVLGDGGSVGNGGGLTVAAAEAMAHLA